MRRGRVIGNLGRAPVPEWEELARASWPARLPTGLTTIAGRLQLPVLAISLAVLLLAAWIRLPWLGLAAWTLGAACEWLATGADRPITRLLDLVGFRAQWRALVKSLVAAALVFATTTDPLVGFGYVLVVLVLQLAWLLQPVLATWLWRSAPPLRYLPRSPRQPDAFVAHAAVYARGVGTPGALVLIEFVALAVATTVVALPSNYLLVITGLLVVAGLGYLARTLIAARRLHTAQQRLGADLLADLTPTEPAFVVYVSLAARQSKYIVNQWLPAFDEQPRNGLIVVREASQLAPLDATRLPVFYAPTTRDVEQLVLPGVRAAFYLAYGERNATLLRDPRLKHVMLAHGDSDKATSASALIRAFDETWVAGQAGIDRFAAAGIDLGPERFAVIGRPQAAGLPIGPTGQQPQVLLYAPTFEGYYEQTTHSSLDVMGAELVRRLVAEHREVQVWFRPHPASGVVRPSMLAAIAEISELLADAPGGHVVAVGEGSSLTDCLVRADVLVSDISSVISDFLNTERPVIVCDPDGLPREAFVARYPSQAGSYLLHPGLAELDEVLAAALGDDPLRAKRLEMKRHVLGDPPGGAQAAFAANLERVCSPDS